MPSSGATRKSAGRRARTILLVDPSPDRLSSLEQTLGEEHNLTCATTAEEAIQRIQTTGIELVVASAEVCSSRLLEVVASNGLSRACIFLAAPNQSETLVRAYAAQHTFRVLSSDRSAQTLRAFVHSALYPREAARHSIPGVVAKLTLGDGSTTSCPLLDLSNRGLAVRLDSPRGVLLPGTAIPQVALYRDTEQLLDGVAGTVRYIEVIAPGEACGIGYKVGLELKRLPDRRNEQEEEILAEPLRILALLKEGLPRGSCTVRIADTRTLVSAGHSAQVVDDPPEIQVTCEAPSEVEIGDVVETRFDLAGSSYAFLASIRRIHRTEPSGYSMGMPRALRIVRQRRSVRIRPRHDNPIMIQPTSPFTGPCDPRPAMNITASGIAFGISETEELLPPGTRIPQVLMRFGDGTELTSRAVVRTLVPKGPQGAPELVCGLEFDGLSAAERARIADAIVHSNQPELRDGTGTPFHVLWNFLQETRFLYPEKLAAIRVDQVESTLKKLLEQPNDVLKTSLVVKDGRIEGHASGLHAYRNTWMLQHLAALASGKSMMTRGRMLNLAVIEYLEQLPGIEWVKIWFRPTNRWPARVFGGFARKLADPDLSHLKTYVYMVSPSTAGAEADGSTTVRPGVSADFGAVEAHFVAAREAVLLRSDDLTSEHLLLDEVAKVYANVDLVRRRELLIAERGGRFVGFALLEVSSRGLNFSELTNVFRVYARDVGDRDAKAALVARARARYAELGCETTIGLADQDDVNTFLDQGFRQAKQYSAWTWHRSQYQAFCEHVLKLRV
jgi:DNA-binding NarL/FixJ family response regulator